MPMMAKSPVDKSLIGTPDFTGFSEFKPVKDINPLTPWMTLSYAGLFDSASSPKPLIEQEIIFSL